MKKTTIEHYEVGAMGTVGDLLDALVDIPTDAHIVSIETTEYVHYRSTKTSPVFTIKAERDVSSD